MGSRRDGESSPEPRFQNIFQRTLCNVKTTSKVSMVSSSFELNSWLSGPFFAAREVSLISSNFFNTGYGYVSCLKNVSILLVLPRNFNILIQSKWVLWFDQRPLSGVILLFILKPNWIQASINIGQFHQKYNFQKQRFFWDFSNT